MADEEPVFDDIMVDLETLGVNGDAAFISIGACYFCRKTSKIGITFYERVDWDSVLERCSITASTIKWWMKQKTKARLEIIQEGEILDTVLDDFRSYYGIKGGSSCIWGNGATFDISILEHAYDYNAPWAFCNIRDVRTIVDLAHGLVDKRSVPFEGVEHNALDDAIHQAKYVAKMIQALKRGK